MQTVEQKPRNTKKERTETKEAARSPREIERRKPLQAMIEKGKDPLEATLFSVIDRLLDDLTWEEDYRRLSSEEKERQCSLRWNADEIFKEIIRSEADFGVQSPKSYFYHPIFANYWKELRHRWLDLWIRLTNIHSALESTILNRPSKLRGNFFTKRDLKAWLDELPDQIEKIVEDKEQLSLVIGFCLGLRAYKQELKSSLDRVKLDVTEKFTIKTPETELPESQEDREKLLAKSFSFGTKRNG